MKINIVELKAVRNISWKLRFCLTLVCQNPLVRLSFYSSVCVNFVAIISAPYRWTNFLIWWWLYKDQAYFVSDFDACLISTFCFVELCPLSLYGKIEKIFCHKKISAPKRWIDFKYGVWLCIDRAYIVSYFRCCPLSTSCTSRVYLTQSV